MVLNVYKELYLVRFIPYVIQFCNHYTTLFVSRLFLYFDLLEQRICIWLLRTQSHNTQYKNSGIVKISPKILRDLCVCICAISLHNSSAIFIQISYIGHNVNILYSSRSIILHTSCVKGK